MISFEKAAVCVIQTMCVGALLVALISTNSNKLSPDNMALSILGATIVTVVSGIISLGLAVNE